VLSFLPLQHVVELRHARLIRLSRIVLLVGYWSPMVRDLWSILVSRERRFQILFVLFSGVVLSFAGAVVLHWLASPDFDGDRQQDTFFATLWWSFRQVEDPGNLVESPTGGAVVVVSLLLTFAGLVLFSFLVGIGTAAIDERGASLYPGDARSQIDCTLDKIAALVEPEGVGLADVASATAFVKRPGDAAVFRDAIAARGLHELPHVVVVADVCRDELLFEMDAEIVSRRA